MAISVIHSLILEILDSDGGDLARPKPLSDSSEYDEYNTLYAEIASEDSFVSLPFGPVTTGELIVVKSTQEITIKLDADADILFPAKELFVLKSDTGITQVDIKNVSGSTAIVRGYIFGT